MWCKNWRGNTQRNDDAHKNKMKQMGEMNTGPESVKKYMDDFKVKFDALPED